MDPAVARAAIEAVRKQLRSRIGGKVSGPPEAGAGGPPPEGGDAGDAPAAEATDQGAEGAQPQDEILTCPNCHAQFPLSAGEAPPPQAGPPQGAAPQGR